MRALLPHSTRLVDHAEAEKLLAKIAFVQLPPPHRFIRRLHLRQRELAGQQPVHGRAVGHFRRQPLPRVVHNVGVVKSQRRQLVHRPELVWIIPARHILQTKPAAQVHHRHGMPPRVTRRGVKGVQLLHKAQVSVNIHAHLSARHPRQRLHGGLPLRVIAARQRPLPRKRFITTPHQQHLQHPGVHAKRDKIHREGGRAILGVMLLRMMLHGHRLTLPVVGPPFAGNVHHARHVQLGNIASTQRHPNGR